MLFNAISGAFARLKGQCRVCHAWPAQAVCEACVAQFAQPRRRCHTCALPMSDGIVRCGTCLTRPPPLDLCLASVPYAFPWSRLIGDFKFQNEPGLCHCFATLLRATPWVEPALENADLVLPMPLSPQRLKNRGYNQAYLLACELKPEKARADLLLRIKDTPAQHTLKRAQRLAISHSAFAIEPLKARHFKGAKVVLVDDVMTTGASLFACAHVLKSAGAAQVTALVIARTE